jgi:hypothetical protein
MSLFAPTLEAIGGSSGESGTPESTGEPQQQPACRQEDAEKRTGEEDSTAFLRGIIWIGVDILSDIRDALGLDVQDRFIEMQFLFDTLISRGTLCHHNDETPRSSMTYQQLSMHGWVLVTKLFALHPWTTKKNKAKSLKKDSWQRLVWVDDDNFKPFPKVNAVRRASAILPAF